METPEMSLFDINTFRSKINQYQGLSKTSLFVVDIDRIGNTQFQSGDIRFFCQSASIPGMSFGGVDHKMNGIGQAESLPSGISVDPVSCLFMMDSTHQVMTFFHRWAQAIVNFNAVNLNSEVDGKLPYEMGYRDEYSANITITFYSSEDAANSYSVTLRDAYPSAIGSVALSYSDTNQYAILPVSFTHSGVNMSSMIEGTSTNRMNRGNGMLGMITTFGGGGGLIGQLISQKASNNIQNALDKYTRVKNALDAIKSIF